MPQSELTAPMGSQQPLGFADMLELHANAKKASPLFANMTLPQFSATMKQETGSDMFDQGLNDSYVKRFSAAIDRGLQPLSKPAGEAGASLMDMIGLGKYREQGRSIGEGLPRGLAEAIPAGIGFGALVAPDPTFISKGVGASLLGGAAASSFAGGYEKTGSPLVGAIQGMTTATFPGFSNLGLRAIQPLIKGLLYKPAEDVANALVPKTAGWATGVAERGLEAVGRNAGLAAQQVGSMGLSRMAQGQSFAEFSPEYAIDIVGATLPMALVDAFHIIKGPRIAQTEVQKTPTGETTTTRFAEPRSETAGQEMQNYMKQVEAERLAKQTADAQVEKQKQAVTEERLAPPAEPETLKVPQEPTIPFMRWKRVLADLQDTGSLSVENLTTKYGLTPEEATAATARLKQNGYIDDTLKAIARPPDEQSIMEEARRMNFLMTGKQPIVKEMSEPVRGEEDQPRTGGWAAGELPRVSLQPGQTASEGVRQARRSVTAGDQSAEDVLAQARVDKLVREKESGAALREQGYKPQTKEIGRTRPGELDQLEGPEWQRFLAKGGPIEQLKAQFLERYERPMLEHLAKPVAQMGPLEQIQHIWDITERLQDTLRDAGAGHEAAHSIGTFDEIRSNVKEGIALGMSPMVALERARIASMHKLGTILQRLEVVEQETLLHPEFADPKKEAEAREFVSVTMKRLSRLNELPPPIEYYLPGGGKVKIDYAKALADVSNEPPFRTGGGGHSATSTDDARTHILAAGSQFFHEKFPTQGARDEYLAGWRKAHTADRFAGLSDPEAMLEAFKGYVRSQGVWKGREYSARERLWKESKEAMEEGQSQELKNAVKEKTPEQASADEAAEDAATMKARLLRERVPLQEYRPLDWKVALEKVGSEEGVTKATAEKLNKMLAMFYNNEIGFSFDPQNRSELMAVAKTGWQDIATRIGMQSPQGARLLFNEKFKPAMRGFVKWKIEDEGRLQASTLPEKDALFESMGMPTEKANTMEQGAAMAGAKRFFTTYLSRKGLNAEQTRIYSDIAAKVAAVYHDVGYTRIGELVTSKGVHGLTVTPNMWTPSDVFLRHRDYFQEKNLAIFTKLQTLGHELFHALTEARLGGRLDPQTGAWVDNVYVWAHQLTPQERSDVLTKWTQFTVPGKVSARDAESFQKMLEHRGKVAGESVDEFLADLVGHVSTGLASPDNETWVRTVGKEVLFAPTHEQQFVKGLYLPLHDMYDSLKSYFGTYVGDSKTADAIGKILEGTTSILKSADHAQFALDAMNHIQQFDPVYYSDLMSKTTVPDYHLGAPGPKIKGSTLPISDTYKAAREFLGFSDKALIEKEYGVQPGFFPSWFFPAQQLAKRYPVLQPVVDLAFSFNAFAKSNSVKLLTPLGVKTTGLGHLTLDPELSGLKVHLKDREVNEASTVVGLVKQLDTSKRLTDKEIRDLLPEKMSEENKQHIINFHRALEGTDDNPGTMPLAGGLLVKHWQDKVGRATTSVVQLALKSAGVPIKAVDALAIGENFKKLMIASDDPTMAASVPVIANELQAKLGAEVFKKGLDTAQGMWSQVKELEKKLVGQPSYIPESRLGRYMVAWKWADRPDRKAGAAGFKTPEEAIAYRDKMKDQGALAKTFDKYDRARQTSGLDEDLVARYAAIDDAARKSAIAALGADTPVMKEFDSLYTPGVAVMREVAARGMNKYLQPRKLGEGRETTNIADSVIAYIATVSRGIARSAVREEAAIRLNDPDLIANPKLQALGQDHITNVTQPPTREWTLFKNLNFAYYMGFNLSTMVMEGSQNFLTFAPFMTRKLGSVADSYRYLGKGMADTVGMVLNKGKFKDADVEAAVSRARDEGVIDLGIHQEMQEKLGTLLPNLGSAVDGGHVITKAAELAKKPLWWYLTASRWLYSHAPRANAHVAFVGAFRAATEKLGMDKEQAYSFATDAARTTQYGGGEAGRPVRLFNPDGQGLGAAHGLMGVLYSLQTYTFSTIAMMGWMGREAIAGGKGMAPHEKSAARKAFGQMMLTQFALGGAMGMPFTAGMVALIDQLFPEAEVKKNVRELFKNLVKDDEDLGNTVADLALKGGPTTAFGADFSSRVSLGNLFGVSAYDGFSLANLIGPTGGIFENLAKGIQQGSTGDVAGAAKSILPSAYKNLVDLASNDWQMRDKAGRLIYDPSDAEKALYALGIRPKQLSDYREAQTEIEKTNEVEKNRLARFHQTLAQQLLGGDVGGVRQALMQKGQEDSLYDVRSGARRVAELAQEMVTPSDLTLNGARTAGPERQTIASMYPGLQGSTEVQRLVQRKGLERTLGIQGAGQVEPRELSQAQVVDTLVARGIDRSTAKQMAQQVLGHRPQKPVFQ